MISANAAIHRGFVGFALVLGGLVSAGCSEGMERVTVRGSVTVDGQPIREGLIRFIPSGESKGPVWAAMIFDGKYEAAGKGVPVGTLMVQIEAYRAARDYRPNSQSPEAAPEDLDGAAPQEQYLPAKYNSQSTLTLTIDPGQGDVIQDYDLSLN